MSPLPKVQKVLSEMGIASRRKAEDLIREGRITINGRPAQIGDRTNPSTDHIKVDGRRVSLAPPKIYILLNKPKGVVTTTDDPEGRKTVLDLLQVNNPRLFPVGRLDYDAEGLLLLTNDGQLAHCLSHPSFRIPRTYQVKVKGKPTAAEIHRVSRGISLEDGPTAPCRVAPLRETEENRWVEMVLYEGRNRQVKRMWEKLGYPVLKLKRVGFAGLSLGKLQPRQYRSLRPGEVQNLKKTISKDAPKNHGRQKENRMRMRNEAP